MTKFNGADYDQKRDDQRLTRQYRRVFNLMKDGEWRTLADISAIIGDPPASVSAQLRHLRKARFGKHTVERKYVSDGVYLYRLILNPASAAPEVVAPVLKKKAPAKKALAKPPALVAKPTKRRPEVRGDITKAAS